MDSNERLLSTRFCTVLPLLSAGAAIGVVRGPWHIAAVDAASVVRAAMARAEQCVGKGWLIPDLRRALRAVPKLGNDYRLVQENKWEAVQVDDGIASAMPPNPLPTDAAAVARMVSAARVWLPSLPLCALEGMAEAMLAAAVVVPVPMSDARAARRLARYAAADEEGD